MASIENWSELTVKDIFYAYRKAKADCYFEKVNNTEEDFIRFEQNLAVNLLNLLSRLKNGEIDLLLKENIGEPRVVAKKISYEKKVKPFLGAKASQETEDESHIYFSDSSRAFEYLRHNKKIVPEFRLIGHFSVVMHVLSALWVNSAGDKFDKCLSSSSYGSRLRRYKPPEGATKGTTGSYHLESIGSFNPYFEPYKKWRECGLKAIRRELEDDEEGEKSVIAITMDIKSYYHNIDPSFVANEAFHKYATIHLTKWEKEFTESFVEALKTWSSKAKEKIKDIDPDSKVLIGGIPIGLSITHVIANTLLIVLDRDIIEGLTPIFYGRYVDDMFLVLRDTKTIKNTEELFDFIKQRTVCFSNKIHPFDEELGLGYSNTEDLEYDDIPIDLDDTEIGLNKGDKLLNFPKSFIGDSKLILQKGKQKVFFLSGQGGLDLLDNIQTQIRNVSSERRLMPSVDKLEETASAKILTAADNAYEEADTLRKADGLSIRRLSWSVQLRAVEILAHDLDKDDWKKERKRFYQFAMIHVLRPDKILDHIDYLPRLISIAISMNDWADAMRLYECAIRAQKKLKNDTVFNGVRINGIITESNLNIKSHDDIWEGLKETTKSLAKSAIVRALNLNRASDNKYFLTDIGKELAKLVGLEADPEKLYELAIGYIEADLAKTPYKEHLKRNAKRQKLRIINEESLLFDEEKNPIYQHLYSLIEFLNESMEYSNLRVNENCDHNNYSFIPYLFPTRPYTTQEISLFLPNKCIFSDGPFETGKRWAEYVRAVRGVWVWNKEKIDEELLKTKFNGNDLGNLAPNLDPAYLGTIKHDDKILLGITSLKTTNYSWKKSADGKQDISRERYERVERLINQAIKSYPKPNYLLLPELSLPERWIKTVSGTLLADGISLIAGVDYTNVGSKIYSEAVLILTDSRLGFPSSVQIRQPKTLPAAGEEVELHQLFGKTWKDFSIIPDKKLPKKPLYIHNGFYFSVLICSELQNIKYRSDFQGNVDSMMILSWNKDIDTFASLVESASLDVHAYIALVNNRQYGDSRVRAPAKETYKKDLCRLRGGENEYLVIVSIDIDELRAFQSRAIRAPKDNDPYKPVPEGFKILPSRRTLPK